MGNCTSCNRFTEYQDGPYLCYLCKNPPFAAAPVAEPVKQKAPEPSTKENPWTLGQVRMSAGFGSKRRGGMPPCKLCKSMLVSHRGGRNAEGVVGYYDDPNAWACPKSSKPIEWENQQWFVPDKF